MLTFEDHIPKTPGPPIVSDRESDEDKSDAEKEEEVKNVGNDGNDSDSDSASDSSQSDSSIDNTNERNDSEVERSDNENEDKEEDEDMDDNNEAIPKAIDTNEANDEMSSDDNEENEDKNINGTQDNEEESDEEVVRKRSPSKKRQLEDDSESSDDEKSEQIKRQRTESNENEDIEDNEDKNEEMADKSAKATDIFGELSSEDEEEEDRRKRNDRGDDERASDKDSDNENRDNVRRDVGSGDEDNVRRVGDSDQPFIEDEEVPEEPIPETRIEVEIPRIVADLGTETHFVKLPNFLSIDTHPYDPQWYEDEIDEDENLDDEGRARLKLKVENTIRWRNVVNRETNELNKESNTRVVKWSDGSFSLHLGEEIFDINKLELMTGDNNHLFIRQGTGLQGQAVFRTKLNFRPFSTESFTHRKLTLSLADRSQKTQKIRVLPNVGKDPEAHRTEMIKKEEDRLKASIRRENKQRRVRERSLIRGPTASYLEPDGDEDDEEEGISIARIKNQYKKGAFTKTYEDSEDSPEESN